MTSQRILELAERAWYWLPVRGRVGVTILALAQLYWVWWFYLHYVRAPFMLYRVNVIPRDVTRTLDPVYAEPVDPDLLRYLEDTERKLIALGFRVVPVTIVNGRPIKGFDEPALRAALAAFES